MSSNCPILECNITAVNKFVECPHCAFKACLNCCKYFILHSNASECMSCKKVWNDDFVDLVFPKAFRKKELKKHRESIMFERQEAMFGETLELIKRNKKAEKIFDKIDELTAQIRKYERELIELRNNTSPSQESKEKIIVVKKCPKTDCQGYLDSDSTCAICNTVLCCKCEKIKLEEHECNKDDVETVKLKKKITKPCPTCSRPTFKCSGCPQVWCPPPCNSGKGTAWNFNTGEIDKGAVHSPDYYDYMRKNNGGIVPAQNACRRQDEIPEIWSLYEQIDPVEFTKLTNIHRFFVDLQNYRMNKYLENHQGEFQRNLDLRMKYLTNEVNKENYKKTLFARNKKENKNRTIYQNLDMLYKVGTDIFNQFKYHPTYNRIGYFNTDKTFQELENIRLYYNETIRKTKDRYDCKSLDVSRVTSKWQFSY